MFENKETWIIGVDLKNGVNGLLEKHESFKSAKEKLEEIKITIEIPNHIKFILVTPNEEEKKEWKN